MRVERMEAVPVDLAPSTLEPGKLYVSRKYSAAVHTCCCGCGAKVVTPLSAAEWQVIQGPHGVSVSPSIGNARPCRTHYWIHNGHVLWHRPMTDAHVDAVFQRDARALQTQQARQRAPDTLHSDAPSPTAATTWLDRLLRWLFG